MPLVSSGGGKVRTSAPIRSKGLTDRGTSRKFPKSGIGKAPVIKSPTRGVAGATKTVGKTASDDPFAFIKDLMSGSDPASVQALIDKIYAPSRDAINQQLAQSGATAKARADQMSQVYGAFAQYMGGLQGNLNTIYQNGRSDGQALAGGMSGPTGAVGDHLATLAGEQNTMLDAKAKGWSEFGASMPGVYSLMATQEIKSMLQAANASDDQLRAKLLDLNSQEATAVLNYLNDAKAKDIQLKEWAYGQKTSQTAAKAKQNQDYLNYLQKQREINFQHDIAVGKLTLAQATAKENSWYHQQLVDARNQGLIDTETYHSQLIGQGNTRLGIQQQNANTARANSQRAMLNARKLVPAKDSVSRSAGKMMLYNPIAKTYVPALDAKGKPIPYKAAPSTSPNTPGSPGYIQKYKLQETTTMAKAKTEMANLTHGTTSGGKNAQGGKSGHTTLPKMTVPQAKIYIAKKYLPDLIRIAQAQKLGGLWKAYTARQVADYWLTQLV